MTPRLRRPAEEPIAAIDEDEMDDRPVRRPAGRGPRTGMKRSVMRVIRQIPSYLRLLVGLVGDRRVSRLDRLFVIGALVYIVSPLDFIPDLIPFLGEVDDVFLLMMALQRMVERAGFAVLRDHWRGDPDELEDLNLASVISAAGFFLPLQLSVVSRQSAAPLESPQRAFYLSRWHPHLAPLVSATTSRLPSTMSCSPPGIRPRIRVKSAWPPGSPVASR